MPDNHGPISPDQQRRFERARSALEAMCPGRDRQLWVRKTARLFEPDPTDLERVRWLLIAMGRARGGEGGRAIERLARQGYAIGDAHGWRQGAMAIAIPLDAPGLIGLGRILPSRWSGWKTREQAALRLDPTALTPCEWCSAHEVLRIVADLRTEGHDVG